MPVGSFLPCSFARLGTHVPAGRKWTRSICSATAVYHEKRERTGEYPRYPRERSYLEHSARPQERAFQPINTSPLSESCSFGDALLGDTVFQSVALSFFTPGRSQRLGTEGIACTAAMLAEAQPSLFPA